MPFLAAIPAWAAIAGSVGGSVAGGLLNNRKGARTQTSDSTQNYNTTSSTTPVGDPAFTPLRDKVLQMYMDRLQQPTSLAGYEAQGTGNINNVYRLGQQSLSNSLTARGLSTSPVAGSGMATLESGRLGEVANLQNQMPLLERQYANEDLTNAMRMLAMQPYGSSSTGGGSGTSNSSVTFPGSAMGGAFGDLGSMLGFLLGQEKIGGG